MTSRFSTIAAVQRSSATLRRHHQLPLDQHPHFHHLAPRQLAPSTTPSGTASLLKPRPTCTAYAQLTPRRVPLARSAATSTPPSIAAIHTTRCRASSLAKEQDQQDNAEMAAADDESWKSQPPYRTSEANEEFDKKWTARCSCGRVNYWLSREKPLASKYCHCKDCQSLHGEYILFVFLSITPAILFLST
jgi:hypothetical protein